jgi:hypothetical protein
MDAVVVFPVYALADDRSMFLVESPARVLYHIEPIDIENKEYLFWDADGRGVRISLKGETVHAIEHTDNDLSLQEAFKLYSEAYGLSTDTTGPIAEVWGRLQEAEAALPKPASLWSRLLRMLTK